jgi:hypothetical protein
MSQMTDHCTAEQLQLLIDRRLDPTAEEADVQEHLRLCHQCRSLYETLVHFEAAVRRMPLSRVSPAFKRSVMASLGLAPKDPLLFRLLEHTAYFFAMLIVLAFTLAAFALSGLIKPADMQQARGTGGQILTMASSAVSAGAQTLGTWLTDFFPFLFSHGALSISMAAAAVVMLLAALDRTFGKWLAPRGR